MGLVASVRNAMSADRSQPNVNTSLLGFLSKPKDTSTPKDKALVGSLKTIATNTKNTNNELKKANKTLQDISTSLTKQTSKGNAEILVGNKSGERIMLTLATMVAKPENVERTSKSLASMVKSFEGFSSDKINKSAETMAKLSGSLAAIAANTPSFKGFAMMAGGLALLGVTLATFLIAVDYESILKFGIITGILCLSAKFLKDAGKDFLKASVGIAILGLALYAFDKVVTLESIGKMTLSLGVMTAAAFAFSKFGNSKLDRGAKDLAILSGSMVLLAGALFVFNKVEYASILKAGAALAMVGTAAYLLSKSSVDYKSSLGIGILAGSMVVLGFAIQQFKGVGIDDVGVAMASLAGVAAASLLLKNVGTSGVMAALSIAAIGGSLVVLGFGLGEFKKNSLGMMEAVNLGLTLTVLSVGYSAIGAASTAILLGAAAIGAIGGSIILLGAGLGLIKTNTPDQKTIESFGMAMTGILASFVSLGNPLYVVPLALGLANSAMMSVSLLALGGSMALLGKMTMPTPEQIRNFGIAATGIRTAFTSFGVMDSVKLLALTPVILSMAASTLMLGGAINLLSKMSTDPVATSNAVASLGSFVNGVKDVFGKIKSEDTDAIHRGIASLSGVGNMVKSLSEGIVAIGAMQFNEYAVENGKLVLKSTRAYTQADFDNVGIGIGKVISAISSPLEKAGDSGGWFTSNKVKKGIEALSSIGTVVTPLTNSISAFTSAGIDRNAVDSYASNMSALINGTIRIATGMQIPDDAIKKSTLLSQIVSPQYNILKTIGSTDLDKQVKAVNAIAGAFASMKDNINAFDMEHLNKTSELMRNMADVAKGDHTQALIDAISSLSDAIGSARSFATQGGGVGAVSSGVTFNAVTGKSQPTTLMEANIGMSAKLDAIADSIDDLVDIFRSGQGKIKTVAV